MTTLNDMAQVRAWAFTHPRAARWMIFLIFLVTGFASFFYGFWVVGTGWYEAGWPLWISLAVLAGTIVVRIVWKGKAPNSSAQVFFHMTMMFIFVSTSIYLGSRFPIKYGGNWNESAFEHAYAASHAPEVSGFSKESKEIPDGVKILLTILIITGAFFMGYLIALLACVLACSDLAVLAALALIAGWGATIWGGVVLLIRLWRKGVRQRKNSKERA